MYDFQAAGTQHLHQRSAILADDPGLGKTKQAIEAYRDARGPILVVTTMRNKLFWAASVLAWLGDDEDVTITEAGGRFDIANFRKSTGRRWLVTHWQALQRKAATDLLDFPWWGCIIDEAHRLDRNTKQGQFLTFQLRSAYYTMLTATPMERSADDMWPMLHLCDKQKFSSYWAFRRKWVRVKEIWVGNGRGGVRKVEIVEGTNDPQGFATIIAPYYMRRRKADVAGDLPPVQTVDVPISLNGLTGMYAKLEEDALVQVSKTTTKFITGSLARLVYLQQWISCPKIFGSDKESPKAEWLKEYLDDHPDEPVLVFVRFRETAQHLAGIAQGGMAVTGGVGWNGWPANVRYVVATYGTLQDSVNLDYTMDGRAVSTVVVYDLNWSSTTTIQSTNRVHRLTTKLPVTEYILHIRGTVDDDIKATLDRKLSQSSLIEAFLRRKQNGSATNQR